MKMRSKTSELTGWGAQVSRVCRQFRPERGADISPALENIKDSYIPRGLGRSYGDATLNIEGVIHTQKLDKFIQFDEETGHLTAQSGVTVADVLQYFLHKGWVLPAMPGTKYVTLGGCVASDVHGRDHHIGTFGHHVVSLVVHTGDGRRLKCSANAHADLFRATIGGMGLTGLIEEVTVQMQKVPSSTLDVTCKPFHSASEAVSLFKKHSAEAAYTGTWVDALAPHYETGRGWAQFSKFVEKGTNKAFCPSDDWPLKAKLFDKLAPLFPPFMLNKFTMGLFNRLIVLKTGRGWRRRIQLPALLFPLDSLPAWNRLYGKKGFYQFQCVIPGDDASQKVHQMLRKVQQSGTGAYFCTIKPFGAHEPAGMLSFGMKGLTLALDIPNKNPDKAKALLNDLAERTLEAKGKVYLTKDAALSAEQFQKMYPNWEEFLAVKRKYDSEDKVQSTMYRRLFNNAIKRQKQQPAKKEEAA